MEKFLTAALAPFALFVMLLVAWPVKRWLQLNMRDGWLKRLLLNRRGDAMRDWFERLDDRIYRLIRLRRGR